MVSSFPFKKTNILCLSVAMCAYRGPFVRDPVCFVFKVIVNSIFKRCIKIIYFNSVLTGAYYIVERPAAEGVPELIRIIDEEEGNDHPIYISSDDEDGEMVPYAAVDYFVGFPARFVGRQVDYPLWNPDTDDVAYDGESEYTDSSSDVFDIGVYLNLVNQDSGYDSMSEVSSDDEEDDLPPRPLTPPAPRPDLQEDLRPEFPDFYGAGRISPFGLWDLQESFAEDSDSSDSGHSTSRKRCREESDEEPSTAKRPRISCEESLGEE